MVFISVVMPVYNTPVVFLEEAVESILNQTFTEFEFIIIDDCSDKQESVDYLHSLKDKRIRIIKNKDNQGITKSLNIGIQAAKGKYIARMDSDDISLPERFAKQYCFMETHPDVILCGTATEFFGKSNVIWRSNTDDQDLYRIELLFKNAGPSHPSAMFNRRKLMENGLLYDERLPYAEDYMMWVNASSIGRVYCLEEVLVRYRVHGGQVSSRKAAEQKYCDLLTLKYQLSRLLGHVDIQDAENHRRYYDSRTISDEAYRWFKKLIAANKKRRVYDQTKLKKYITSIIAEKAYATYGIQPKDPRTYRIIILKYLPVTYFIKKIFEKLKLRISNSIVHSVKVFL